MFSVFKMYNNHKFFNIKIEKFNFSKFQGTFLNTRYFFENGSILIKYKNN